jgi:zinc protease
MVDFHDRIMVPEGAVLSIAGDVNSGQVTDLIARQLGEWSGAAVNGKPLYKRSRETLKLCRDRVKLEMPGRSNATILVMRPGIARLAPDYYAAAVANYIFGGDFASRLNDRLRAVAGLTYGSYSFTSAGRGQGPWTIYIQVNPANVAQATELALAEWQRMYDEGATEPELNRAKSYLTGNFVVRLNTIGAVASAFAEIAHYDLGLDYFQRYQQIVNGLTLEKVNEAFRKNFALDDYVVITAGNV